MAFLQPAKSAQSHGTGSRPGQLSIERNAHSCNLDWTRSICHNRSTMVPNIPDSTSSSLHANKRAEFMPCFHANETATVFVGAAVRRHAFTSTMTMNKLGCLRAASISHSTSRCSRLIPIVSVVLLRLRLLLSPCNPFLVRVRASKFMARAEKLVQDQSRIHTRHNKCKSVQLGCGGLGCAARARPSRSCTASCNTAKAKSSIITSRKVSTVVAVRWTNKRVRYENEMGGQRTY